jgi:hypothetical protein
MLVSAPLMEAEQDGSIRIQDLTEVVMARKRLDLAEKRLVPFEATRDVPYADDRPCAFHRISVVGPKESAENPDVERIDRDIEAYYHRGMRGDDSQPDSSG